MLKMNKYIKRCNSFKCKVIFKKGQWGCHDAPVYSSHGITFNKMFLYLLITLSLLGTDLIPCTIAFVLQKTPNPVIRNYRTFSTNGRLLGLTKSRGLNYDSLDVTTLMQKCGIWAKWDPGIYFTMPIGHRIIQRIQNIIAKEMKSIGCVELSLPILQPNHSLQDKFSKFKDVTYCMKNRSGLEFTPSPSCEEACSILLLNELNPISADTLPLSFYQIRSKFRDEIRSSDVRVRLREFLMKDGYSFHATDECANETYQQFIDAYSRIFNSLGLKYSKNELDDSLEFLVTLKDGSQLEIAHAFKLGTYYSDACGLNFESTGRQRFPVKLNSYGIGIERLLYASCDYYRDEDGLLLPSIICPYDIGIISLDHPLCSRLTESFEKSGISVLTDERDLPLKSRLQDMRACGIPHIFVMAPSNEKFGHLETNLKLPEHSFDELRHLVSSAIAFNNNRIAAEFPDDLLIEYYSRKRRTSTFVNIKQLFAA
ncbi:bifunctional Class II Aminoacyl-tRNA synthetase-Biotinyl protein ligase (BPL) and lipoyl protein ligase (LPL)/Anticodon-binding domain superfamily/Aminoacyl-tRNA synthetase [Babesia duncani]|uniref:Bifunctional Class II Aminoacyl-tRNA synthetase-Biotinyl protein ligase (BPL) and lipoyl protein ligase (LPL)/Anticodon-binding domain superfamily/Aminoacyl-tRNA synthetase n=1 Tax=Babesia duncani TaxID=323732 RepID=A0AAD9PIE6_9APIC|nr:bifunctional Class II Aminoacyl-tRNA synthetase-Biotinyl protein ligase (BPL) and lipoyl protein ligase (LPL)/Anticodon-binding domain superfamily/Aminoacyl-tRNA synthetase [Babesia duncani]